MTSSVLNIKKEKKAFSKSQFYYIATCLTPLNKLLFVGSSIASNDPQLSRAHEYSMTVAQMLPIKAFCIAHAEQLLPPSRPHSLADAGVGNYCLTEKV